MRYGKKFGFRSDNTKTDMNKFSKEALSDYYKACSEIQELHSKALYDADRQYTDILKELDAARKKGLNQAFTNLLTSEGVDESK